MKIKKVETNFTQVSNTPLNDKRLSWTAKGVFAYLYSKPDHWDYSSDRMKYDSSDGRKTLLNALKELEACGYLKRKKLPTGKVEYRLDYHPESPLGTLGQEPEVPLGTMPKGLHAERARISNTENTSNTEKESKTEKPAGSIKYLSNIPKEDIEEWQARFIVSEKEIKSKGEDLKLYCESKGRTYKNYRSMLLNSMKKDFKERDNASVAGGKYEGL